MASMQRPPTWGGSMLQRRAQFIAILCAGFTILAASASGQNQPPIDQPAEQAGADEFGGWSSNQIVVRFRRDWLRQQMPMTRTQGPNRHAIATAAISDELSDTCWAWDVQNIRPAYPFKFGNPELAKKLGLDQFYVVDVPQGTDTPAMTQMFRQCGAEVESAGLSVVGGIAAPLIPNDTNFGTQWGMNNTGQSVNSQIGISDVDIDAPEAWEIETGFSTGITIAIIDSGILATHSEFIGRVLPGINTNDNPPSTNTSDPNGHGTHVAGIAAASGNNIQGVAGVTWGADLLPVRVVTGGGLGNAAQAAAGIVWAVDNGADVCNMSLQYCSAFAPPLPWNGENPADLAMLEMAVDYAKAQGVLVVAAAGNSQCAFEGMPPSNVSFPGKYPNAMAVAAITNQDFQWFSSATSASGEGPEVDVAAPGENIWSTRNNGGYQFNSGTSMATPHVSGLAALIWSFAPYLTDDQVRNLLTSTSVDIGTAGRDDVFGFGRINAHAALVNVPAPLTLLSSFPPSDSIDARQPSDIGGANPAGWDTIHLMFDADPTGLGAEDFTITTDPPVTNPTIQSVTVLNDTVTIQLDGFIPVEAWTIFTHNASGQSVRLGYLPGDVNGSLQSNAQDITSLVNAINGVGPILEDWSTDVNRSNMTQSQDITTLVNLLNGAGSFNVFFGATLPN